MENILEDDTGPSASCSCLLSLVPLFLCGAIQGLLETRHVGILVIV